MQSSFRPKTQKFAKRMILTENLQNLDFEFDFISPWNDSSSRVHRLSPTHYPQFNTMAKTDSINGMTQKIKRIRVKNSRIKTEEPKNVQFRNLDGLGNRIEDISSNFFAMNFIKEKTGSSPLKLKKKMHTKSRQKFKTPVVNLNEYSFAQRFKQQFDSILPRTFNKEKNQLKLQKKEGFNLSLKENSYQTSVRMNKPEIKKIMTQKMIPFTKTPVYRQKNQNQFGHTSKDSGGIFPEQLRRIMQSQMEPVIKKIKSKSLNKFNKTFY